MLAHISRTEVIDQPVAALAVRGKELQLDDTAGEARQLFTRRAVKVVPVLDEDEMTYVGLVCLRGDRHRLCVDTARLDCRPLVSNR